MDFFRTLHGASDWALGALRVGLGVVFLVHGVLKWPMWKAQPSPQLPASLLWVLRLLSIMEPLGGVAVLVGFLTQAAAAGFAIIMLGAIRLKALQLHKGFTGEGGWEFDFMTLAAAVALFILGPGGLSLDHLLLGL